MPVISLFFGIVIRMFYREHGIAHFHAEYQGQQATFTFDGEVLAGALQSRTALHLIKEWAILPTVIRAEYRGNYRIWVLFNDGVESSVDFSDWLTGPVFEPLQDPGYFQRFFLDGGTVAWPNGADIAPETLYEQARSSKAA